MLAKRAYQLIRDGKTDPSILCPEQIATGKLSRNVAYEFSRGPGLPQVGGRQPPLYSVTVYWLDEDSGAVYRDVGFTTIKEEAAHKHIERMRALYANGVPKRIKNANMKLE